MRVAALSILVCLLEFVALASAEQRTWTSADGKFSVEAELLEINGPAVKIKTAAGKEISLPLTKLSQKDRDYVLVEKKKRAATKPAGAAALKVAASLRASPGRVSPAPAMIE